MARGHGLGVLMKILFGLRLLSIGSAKQSNRRSGDRGSKALPAAATRSFYVLWRLLRGKPYRPSMERTSSSAGESRTGGNKPAFPDEAELRKVFERLDENNDGAISSDELRQFVKNLGFNMSPEEVQSVLKTVDENGDGMVNFEEFCSLYPRPGTDSEQVQNEKAQEEDLMRAFRVYDQDGDGFIDDRELRAVLTSLKIKEGFSPQKCKEMIKSVDKDGNGKVDFQEFKKLMSSDTF